MKHLLWAICLGKSLTRGSTAMLAVAALLLGGAAGASAATLCVNPSGQGGCSTTISDAVGAASPGDTIEVASGTYTGNITIEMPLSLVAMPGAKPVIDATNQPTGIFIDGMSAAPGIGVSGVVVSGFEIENANYEGILVANASDVTLVGNHVHDNNTALDISAHTCENIPAFETNEGDDCGEGIHLMATDHVTVLNNDVAYNAGGILISDETGPNHANLIKGNHVHDNPYDCGITLASHGPATSVIPSATLPYGVTDNVIDANVSEHNGYEQPGAGAGVGIFAPFSGTTDAGNVVIDNVLRNNGLPGVTMHIHVLFGPTAPPVNMNDNVIVGNQISGNGADTEDAATAGPTGINLYGVAPVWGTVVSQNIITQEAIGVAFKAPEGEMAVHFNKFGPHSIGVENLGTGTIDATENWWNCPRGPGAAGCATTSGSNVMDMPWLTSPAQTVANPR